MDMKRSILFVIFSCSIFFLWQEWNIKHNPPASQVALQRPVAPTNPTPMLANQTPENASIAQTGQKILVDTDHFKAVIDTAGGDLRSVQLKKHGSTEDPKIPFTLLQDGGEHLYIARTGFLGDVLPSHRQIFTAAKTAYTLGAGQNTLEVRLDTEVSGVKVAKIFVFHQDSYLIDVRYELQNQSTVSLPVRAYFSLIRDGVAPNGTSSMVHTFTGPAVYTSDKKFQKIAFSDIDKNNAEYNHSPKDGWVAMVQHYFISAWLLKSKQNNQMADLCALGQCTFELKKLDDAMRGADGKTFSVYSAAALINLGTLKPQENKQFTVPLYVGPAEDKQFAAAPLNEIGPKLELTKDYGMFRTISAPLFWLLAKIHAVVGNWGWAIILLTIIVKACLYPLSAKSYRSMAKMKELAPKMKELQEKYADDRMKLQQGMMQLYRDEKVNPVGGCLPILIQMPIFMGLYWTLLESVELRQAPFIGWITDLSAIDHWFILPAILLVTTYVQTLLNPPPTDPMQAKMAKIMPLAFGVMFFFFPVGLVLYYLVNNLLTILQQWYVNKTVQQELKIAKK